MAAALLRSARKGAVWQFAHRHLTTLRVAGVPEHFNAPFHVAKERGLYASDGIDFRWCMTPEGSGKMAQLLEADDIDVALMVSEAAVAKVAAGASFKIVGTYVQSPLRLGIHVSASGAVMDVDALKGKVFGVSRMGSNSHLMSYVLAHQRGWVPERDAPLKVVHTLDGARTAMKAGDIDAWVWEYFTTKPLVDSGEWRRVGELHSPWHPFVFVASRAALAGKKSEIRKIVEATHGVCAEFKANQNDSTYAYLQTHHNLDLADSEEWLGKTEWLCKLEVQRNTLRTTQEALVAIGQLKAQAALESMLDTDLCQLLGE